MSTKSQHKTRKDFELTQQDISDIKKRRQKLLDSGGVIYRCTQSSLDGGNDGGAYFARKETVYEYDAQHFAFVKCTLENCGGKAWFSDSKYYEKNLLCLPHAYKRYFQFWGPKKFAEQAWEDLCHARKRILNLKDNNVSYSDLLLFYHPEMIEPSYIVLCALR
jgi:hypothetical protein